MIEQIAELRSRDRHRAIGWRWPQEAATVQTLDIKAGSLAVVPDHLDQVAAPAPEDEQVPGMGIALQRLLDDHP